MSETVAFVGLGMMGHGMALNLLRKGFGLRFRAHRNRSNLADLIASGAQEVHDNESLTKGVSAAIVCVTGTPQVESIMLGEAGLLATMPHGSLIIDCSTAEPVSTANLRTVAGARQIAYIDAPLARTPKEAEQGRLNSMVGATTEDFARAEYFLRAFCENVIHVGPPGHGHVLKLVNNMLAMTTAAAIAEAMTTAARCGLSLNKLFEVVSAGGVNSGIFQMMAGRAVQGDLEGLKFTIANGQKDLRYYTHLAESVGVVTHLGEAVHQSFVMASNLGLGDRYIASLLRAQEQLNAVTIVPPDSQAASA